MKVLSCFDWLTNCTTCCMCKISLCFPRDLWFGEVDFVWLISVSLQTYDLHHRKPTVGLASLTSREVKCTNSLFYRYAIFLKCGKPIRKIEIPNGFLLSKFLVIRDESTAFPVVDEYHSWLRRDPGDNITSPVWTLVHVNVYSTHKYKHAARYTRVTWTYTKLANRQMPWNKISYGRCHIENARMLFTNKSAVGKCDE